LIRHLVERVAFFQGVAKAAREAIQIEEIQRLVERSGGFYAAWIFFTKQIIAIFGATTKISQAFKRSGGRAGQRAARKTFSSNTLPWTRESMSPVSGYRT
jgi:hypothetical protein